MDKPAGVTSARVVDRIKRLLPSGVKVGHAGTLDAFATGLLVLLVGRATRLCEDVMRRPKTYEATIKFGATTTTDDPESPETLVPVPQPPAHDAVASALRSFVGRIEQTPPRYSALKVGGRRASDRARDGQEIDLRPRVVHIYSAELTSFDWPLARVRVECGRGTYIRAVARDLGAALGVGGYLVALRRTRIGDIDVTQAIDPATADADAVARALIPAAPPGASSGVDRPPPRG